jgi:hypothetical protein
MTGPAEDKNRLYKTVKGIPIKVSVSVSAIKKGCKYLKKLYARARYGYK